MTTRTKKKQDVVSQQREKTEYFIKHKTWNVWSYVRLNKDSLDSERACRMIQESLEAAVDNVQGRLDGVGKDLVQAMKDNRDLRKELRETREALNSVIEYVLENEGVKEGRSDNVVS